jgi:hypothetical protein
MVSFPLIMLHTKNKYVIYLTGSKHGINKQSNLINPKIPDHAG